MQLLRKIPFWAVVAFLVYMPLHIFLSQSLSLLTGGLEYWKVVKDGALIGVVVFAICLVFWQHRAGRWYRILLGFAGLYTATHLLVWLSQAHLFAESAVLGSLYNLRLVGYAILGASAVLLYPKVFVFRTIFLIVLGVSTIVALLGIIQYFLPKDILTHLGYSLDRGVRPAFFIDDNSNFPRIMSTLRDPNSLGAYLVVPLSALTFLLTRWKMYMTRRRILVITLYMVHLGALYLTFSRSAWLAACVAMSMVVWWRFSSHFVRLLREYWVVVIVACVVIAGGAYAFRHNPLVDGVLTHSTEAQVGELDSNEYHWLYVQQGVDGVAENPFGHGPGTAGIVSIRNPGGGFLTENYYVQIAYEIGVVGLVVFIGLHVWMYVRLWRRRDGWTIILLASFWAYVLTNMLLHTWSNEAVAAQWWLLAGVALVTLPMSKRGQRASTIDREAS